MIDNCDRLRLMSNRLALLYVDTCDDNPNTCSPYWTYSINIDFKKIEEEVRQDGWCSAIKRFEEHQFSVQFQGSLR
jgi:hypothetical protein